MIAFSSEFLSPFECWANFDVGSWVAMTSESDVRGHRTILFARRTLLDRDVRTARIEVIVRVEAAGNVGEASPIDPVETRNIVTLVANQPSTRSRIDILEHAEEPGAFSSIHLRGTLSPSACRTAPEKQSRESLRIGNRILSCTRGKTRLEGLEPPTLLEFWSSPEIPGGIAKYVVLAGDPPIQATTATVTSFQIGK
jgi:hypothetical protein